MTAQRPRDALFLTYTGLLEPLGVSQVLPYVRGLAARGHRMAILSFEKPADPVALAETRRLLASEGIEWEALRYHKRPPVVSTMADVARGFLRAHAYLGRGVRLLHARAHVPALVAHALWRTRGVRFLFDHRGRMADEFADAGIWPAGGVLYRAVERWERRFVRDAAATVVLTERLRQELGETSARATVIPCAVDLAAFQPAPPAAPREFDLVHAGSWSGLYLARETLRFFAAFRRLRPSARLLLLVPGVSAIRDLPEGVEARTVAPAAVPALLARAGAGLSLRQPGRAQVAASPVKVSEALACGLPVVSTPGVGDLDTLVPGKRVGVVLRGLSDDDLRAAARELIALQADPVGLARRCRALAEERYGLPSAVEAYDGIYRALLARDTVRP
ncbi:MAG: hypothetical protein DMF78_10580 [Acidobacteria bacterium]|nr:MAG: hypothetical protein DMF78_10580 [Acidobacteriota bacterium]